MWRQECTPENFKDQVSIDDLKAATGFESAWTAGCLGDARRLLKSLSSKDSNRIEKVLELSDFRAWLSEKGGRSLMVQHTTGCSQDTPTHDTKLSILSPLLPLITGACAKAKEAAVLSFFCGRWKAQCESRGITPVNPHIAMIRAFTHQLLEIPNLKFDPEEHKYDRAQLKALEEGDVGRIEHLFRRLIQALWKTHDTVLLLIDGVHVVGDEDGGFGKFKKVFGHLQDFVNLANHTQRGEDDDKTIKKFNFKILLTLPQESDEAWETLGAGEFVILDLPDGGD